VPAALDLLDKQVHGLGRTVRRTRQVVSEDLGAPSLQGVAERDDLVDLICETAYDHPVQQHCGLAWIIGEIDVAQVLLGEPSSEHLVVGIAETKPKGHAVDASLVQSLRAGEQHAADLVERVILSTAVAQELVLHPAAHMVELLRQGVPEDGILVCDTTTVAYMCHMHYPVYAPRTYLSTSYMGTLGFGYPASLGVKVARPENPVVTVTGDGGFLFAATELATHGLG